MFAAVKLFPLTVYTPEQTKQGSMVMLQNVFIGFIQKEYQLASCLALKMYSEASCFFVKEASYL